METWYKIVTEIEPEWEEVLSYALRQAGSEGIEIRKKPGEEKLIMISYHSRKP